jgi:hypothetical protein
LGIGYQGWCFTRRGRVQYVLLSKCGRSLRVSARVSLEEVREACPSHSGCNGNGVRAGDSFCFYRFTSILIITLSRFRFLSACGVINTTLDTKPYILALDLLLWPFDETQKYPAEGPTSSVGKGLQVQPTTVAHSVDFLLQTLPFRRWYRI